MLSPYCVVALASLLAVAPVQAQPVRASADAAQPVHALKFDWARDGIITGVGGVLWIGSEAFFKDNLAPKTCRWCDRAADGTDTLNGLDKWGRGLAGETPESRKRSDTWSNVVDFAALPVGVFGAQALLVNANHGSSRIFFEDATIVLESAVLASVLNQTVKFIAGRERPFVHVLPEEQKALTDHPTDNNLSFFSGHTTLAFSLVVAAGTVAEQRGYKYRGWIWGVGLPVAASVGLLRMGADKHYLTDVAVGALVGSAFGVAVPLLLHPRQEGTATTSASRPGPAPEMRVAASPGGISFSGRF